MEEKKQHYVEPHVFKQELKEYYETDVMTDKLADNINKIAYGLSFNTSFYKYTYKDDMIGDALVKMYAALKFKKYKFESESNPFSYFTTIAFNAFINRIKREKKHHETLVNYRDKKYEEIMTDPELCQGQIYVKPTNDYNDNDDNY